MTDLELDCRMLALALLECWLGARVNRRPRPSLAERRRCARCSRSLREWFAAWGREPDAEAWEIYQRVHATAPAVITVEAA